MSGLRDQLKARARPSIDYELPVGDIKAAKGALAKAEEEYRLARIRSAGGDEDPEAAERHKEAVAAARAAVEQAEADLAACYVRIKLTALPPEEYEALVALHPPRKDTGDTAWNAETFPLALFLACASDELSEAEWREVITSNVSLAEREDLLNYAGAVNVRLINAALPKG